MIDFATASPVRSDIPPGLRVTRAGNELWRITDLSGRVRAHVRLVTTDAALRFRVERFHTQSRSFRTIGEFWSAREALECVRYQR